MNHDFTKTSHYRLNGRGHCRLRLKSSQDPDSGAESPVAAASAETPAAGVYDIHLCGPWSGDRVRTVRVAGGKYFIIESREKPNIGFVAVPVPVVDGQFSSTYNITDTHLEKTSGRVSFDGKALTLE